MQWGLKVVVGRDEDVYEEENVVYVLRVHQAEYCVYICLFFLRNGLSSCAERFVSSLL